MFKLYAMNVFICILVLHFVANKERFFLMKKGDNEKKYEFTIDFSTDGGKDFYSKLKVNKTIELTFSISGQCFLINPTESFPLKVDTSKHDGQSHIYHSGEIIAYSNNLQIPKADYQYSYSEIIAKIIQADEFGNDFGSLYGGLHDFKFLLEEEEEKSNWKNKNQNQKIG